MKFIKKNLPTLLFSILFSLLPIFETYAAQLNNPLGNTKTVQEFLGLLLTGAIKLGMPIVALAVIYSGFLFVKAQGNTEELTKAKDALLYTLIGAAVLLGAWAIANLVLDTVTTLTT